MSTQNQVKYNFWRKHFSSRLNHEFQREETAQQSMPEAPQLPVFTIKEVEKEVNPVKYRKAEDDGIRAEVLKGWRTDADNAVKIRNEAYRQEKIPKE